MSDDPKVRPRQKTGRSGSTSSAKGKASALSLATPEDEDDPYRKWRNLAYTQPAVKQPTPTTCWAASLSWWGKALKGGRPSLSVDLVVSKYSNLADGASLGLSFGNMIAILKREEWKAVGSHLEGSMLDYKFLKMHIRASGPVVVGYPLNKDEGHYVVVVAPSISRAKLEDFIVMDPLTGSYRAWNHSVFQVGMCVFGRARDV